MAATQVQANLQDRDSPTAKQAETLLKLDVLCGHLLSALLKNKSPFVTDTIKQIFPRSI